MQWFSRWTAGVCCAAVGCAVLELLHPQGAMEKSMRYVLALFFLAALVLPWAEAVPGDLPMQEDAPSAIYNEVTSLMAEQTVRMAEAQLTEAVRTLAAEAGAEPVWVEASIGQGTDGAYRLRSIRLCLPDEQQALMPGLASRIEAQMGLRPEILYASQEGL